ncbi:MAG: hypothetical protein ACREQ8_12425 [Woeseiaceae bacterium]
MAWPLLSTVLRNIPWTELVRRGPQLISATSELLDKRKSGAPPDVRTLPDEADEIELEKRIRALEERHAEHARVFEQLAKQSRDLSVAVEVLAARLRLLTWALVAVIVLGVVGFVLFA